MGLFQKQAKLSGREKTAILLASMGVVNTKEVIKHLTTNEIHKVRMALKKTRNMGDGREVRVLEEVVRYAINKRLTTANKVILDAEEYRALHKNDEVLAEKQARIDNIEQKPDTVATVITKWIDSDDK